MDFVIEQVKNLWRIWIDYGDERAKNYFILSTPFPVTFLLAFYFVLILFIMPWMFNGKKHPKLRYILATYYTLHTIASAFFVIMFVFKVFITPFDFKCQPVQESSIDQDFLAAFVHAYMWYKILELLETVLELLVFGKVSTYMFLHHIVAVFGHMVVIHFYMGGSPMIFGIVNAANHTILYTLYSIQTFSENFRQFSKEFCKKYNYCATIWYCLVSFVYYVQMETRDDCNYDLFRGACLITLASFAIITAFFRVEYILPKTTIKSKQLRREAASFNEIFVN